MHADGLHDVVESVVKAGVKIHFDSSQSYSSWYRDTYANWESDTFEVFKRFVPDKVVLDVGAWIGPTALWCGHVAKDVVALEPTTKAFGEFSANLAANPDISKNVAAVNAALDEQDRTASMTNAGDSMDKLSLIDVRAVTIDTLLHEHPVLEKVGFVKIDTEGYERVIVPALESFFRKHTPVVYVSLHPMFISHEKVQAVVDKLQEIFPHLYEVDMKTPFHTRRSAYNYGDHGGADVLCTWKPLT
jgi:FkbM family methyltransferase